jgi:hypothetical protein
MILGLRTSWGLSISDQITTEIGGAAHEHQRCVRNRRRLIHVLVFALFGLLSSCTLLAQSEMPEAELRDIPFKTWLSSNDKAEIPWQIRAVPGGLSEYQRLTATVEVRVSERTMARHSAGSLVCFAEFTDANGQRYENHDVWNRKRAKLGPNTDYLSFVFEAFVLPGKYTVAIALYDTATKEHSTAHRILHVRTLDKDSLAASWSDLSPVEFRSRELLPEDITDDLKFSVTTRQPIRIEILVNLTATYAASGSTAMYRRTSDALLPELAVLSALSVSNGDAGITLLDLSRQMVLYESDTGYDLDWIRLREALKAIDPNKVSLSSLQSEKQEAQFFLAQVMRRVSAETPSGNGTQPLHVLIVLSGPMEFPKGEDLHPVSPAADCRCRVFYIRRLLVPWSFPAVEILPPPGAGSAEATRLGAYPPPLPFPERASGPCPSNNCNFDRLAKSLAPLRPQVFEVKSPLEFRKALSAILANLEQQ